jgi:hypothetical protein
MLTARDAAACRCGRGRATYAPAAGPASSHQRPICSGLGETNVAVWSLSERHQTSSRIRHVRRDCGGLYERFRRSLLVAERSDEGLLTEPIAGAQPRPQEPVFMPLSRLSSALRLPNRLSNFRGLRPSSIYSARHTGRRSFGGLLALMGPTFGGSN